MLRGRSGHAAHRRHTPRHARTRHGPGLTPALPGAAMSWRPERTSPDMPCRVAANPLSSADPARAVSGTPTARVWPRTWLEGPVRDERLCAEPVPGHHGLRWATARGRP